MRTSEPVGAVGHRAWRCRPLLSLLHFCQQKLHCGLKRPPRLKFKFPLKPVDH